MNFKLLIFFLSIFHDIQFFNFALIVFCSGMDQMKKRYHLTRKRRKRIRNVNIWKSLLLLLPLTFLWMSESTWPQNHRRQSHIFTNLTHPLQLTGVTHLMVGLHFHLLDQCIENNGQNSLMAVKVFSEIIT